MALIKFKANVVTPKVVIIAAACVNAANELNLADMLVTSANDGIHSRGSLHYKDMALDFRTKHLATIEKEALVRVIKRRLGSDYDVILEDEGEVNEHLHVEYDPE